MSILITQGDASGIGPEITVRALRRFSEKDRRKIVLVGSKAVFMENGWDSNLCSLIETSVSNFKLVKGKENVFSGRLSFKVFETAVKLAEKKKIDAIVTAPISKKAWALAGIKYVGHTDYLRDRFKKELLMCFKKGEINTALLTEHVALRDVSRFVKKNNIISKLKLFKSMTDAFACNSQLMVAGLNPHCGDDGVIGKEEVKEIIPAIRATNKAGVDVIGPYNPDDLLKKYNNKKAGGGFFMYHDQLIPLLKFLNNKNDIVHITWGLDFVRTSPAHGTAFDIAYKNTADETSMYEAIKIAMDMVSKN
ncbi:MAG: 4-hydroxythreonine-4-phosphate dehydrogenase PdxA [Elusimicrobiales bacterium]|nr:4-hydroxythreonine-4-phosphate dehydrogenase PdxA [Elusimicrobiales bacterium]